MADEPTRAELNRLYWGTDASVGDIADQLGISRRALYDGIEPRPTGSPCPHCGGALELRNRTAAERREATCRECGEEVRLDSSAGIAEDPEIERMERGAALSPLPRPVPDAASGPALGGALLAGLATGALLGYALRRG